MRIALKFGYDGSKFYGYARQPELKTVEGELVKSLIKHSIIEDTSESVFRSASRTDKSVSALSNVIAFNTASSKNSILENLSDEFTDIAVYGIAEVESDFNPRFAKMRQYRYYITNKEIDKEKIISAAACFSGVNNFTNFAKIEDFKNPVRTIDNIVFTDDKKFLIVDFFAPNFLWNQIRRIVSALNKIGQNKIKKEELVEALCNPEKKVDYGLAPAEPLILQDIIYNFNFEYNEKQRKKLKSLEEKIISLI